MTDCAYTLLGCNESSCYYEASSPGDWDAAVTLCEDDVGRILTLDSQAKKGWFNTNIAYVNPPSLPPPVEESIIQRIYHLIIIVYQFYDKKTNIAMSYEILNLNNWFI